MGSIGLYLDSASGTPVGTLAFEPTNGLFKIFNTNVTGVTGVHVTPTPDITTPTASRQPTPGTTMDIVVKVPRVKGVSVKKAKGGKAKIF